MPTLKDVAKKANVSVTTASYAINGNELIPKETRDKVLTAAKEIGYRPNGIAKNLKKSKSELIGVFLSGFKGPFFNEMLEGVQDEVVKRGYEMVVCASNEKHRLLVEHYVDGAIILNYHLSNELIDSLAGAKMPMVVLDREIDNPFIKNIVLQNEMGMELAVSHLMEKGHKRIGFIGGPEDSYDGEKRMKGYLKSLVSHTLPVNERDILRGLFTEESGYDVMDKYLSHFQKDIPTAFICANDEMAMGAIRALQNSGLNVPEDVAIIGFDDIEVAKFFTPPLSTVRVHKKTWGKTAADVLFKMLNQETESETTEITVELISRSSS
ncbi:LacI family DNA-binding transcriptional regulator [Bacillus sp. H-16]|uniref:LacI family DNA-binding transcriptional regulator n=1 Tax=Alteribacter salitolerans TaxID=2912333 RepID=UPI0019622AFF|nr:LacI family DNA-binding transcriptional regulator [Alteribacter salitolerans]MBM7097898.1 LacI family DNA-binding transcriptional regulator [Alteribacter salitolerans]